MLTYHHWRFVRVVDEDFKHETLFKGDTIKTVTDV